RLAATAGLKLRIGGHLETSLSEGGDWGDLQFRAESGAGSIELPGTFAAPIEISHLALAGQATAGLGKLTIDSLTLIQGASTISGRAEAKGLRLSGGNSRNLRIKGSLELRNMPVSGVAGLWPEGSGGRDWFVGQVEAGTIEQAQAAFEIAFAGGDM